MKHKRPLIFLGVGIINTLLDYLFFMFLTQILLQPPEQIGIAGIISGTFSLVCALLTHSLITWRGARISRKTVFKFIAFTGFGMWVIRPVLLSLFASFGLLHAWVYAAISTANLPFSYDFVVNTTAFGLMVVILLIYNYVVYDRIVFKQEFSNSNVI